MSIFYSYFITFLNPDGSIWLCFRWCSWRYTSRWRQGTSSLFDNCQKQYTKKKKINFHRFNRAREAWEKMATDARVEADEEADNVPPSTLKLYETQFFGFTPQTCMLRVYSAFQDCLYDILPVVEKVCVRQLGRGESAESEELLRARARECSRKLQRFLDERFKLLAERMEALLTERCFSVPPSVLLPEDQLHKTYPQHIQVRAGRPRIVIKTLL